MIVLIFGQPASGKTTLADKLQDVYRKRIDSGFWIPSHHPDFQKDIVRIDGDEWRNVTKNKDYSRAGRIANLKGAFDMAIYLDKQGFFCILSFVTPYEELRQYLSDNAKTIQVCLKYEEDRGRNDFFVSDFEEPLIDCLKLNTTHFSIDVCVSYITDYISKKI